MGFALLKGKNWKYFVKKFQVIIGRSSYNREQGKYIYRMHCIVLQSVINYKY